SPDSFPEAAPDGQGVGTVADAEDEGAVSAGNRPRQRPRCGARWSAQGTVRGKIMQTAEELLNLANQHVAAGRLDQAADLFRQVLALQPRNVSALYQLGRLSLNASRPAEALDCFQRAVTVRPADPHLHTCAGVACQELGRLEEAVRWHRQALQRNPNDPQA